MKIAVAVLVIFCTRFFMSALFYQGQDGDIAWQHWLGTYVLHAHHLPSHLGRETFTSAGARWVPQEWLLSIAVASAIATRHFQYLAGAAALAVFGALFITAYRARRRGASTFAITVTSMCTGFAMLEAFGVRAQVFAWFFLSLLMLLLDLENAWIFLGIPIVALWANVHASALLAPVLTGAWTVGTLIEDRSWTPRVERNVVLTAGTLFAVFLTPLLWNLPLYAVGLATSTIREVITEWQPTDLTYSAFYAGLLPLMGLCIYFGVAAPRERWRDGMLFAVSCVMGFMAVRHMPIAAIVIAPMAAQRLSSVITSHSRINAVLEEPFSENVIFSATALAIVVIVVSLIHVPGITGVNLPKNAVATLARLPGTHNLYCEDFGWCSLALEKHNLRTFLDGRCDPFPAKVWRDYLAVERVNPQWSKVLDRYRADSVLVKKGNALAQALALRTDWHLFYSDRRYEVFLRDTIRTADR
jgi:hypothetical protein